jgi:hypothetical protein
MWLEREVELNQLCSSRNGGRVGDAREVERMCHSLDITCMAADEAGINMRSEGATWRGPGGVGEADMRWQKVGRQRGNNSGGE